MAYFIIECERVTWTKYIVEAEDADAAFLAFDDWEYLGYLDGDDIDHDVIGGPYANRAEALAEVCSYVHG